MKTLFKAKGKLMLILLALCLVITAATSVAFFGAKNTQTASAYTTENKSSFTQINDGNDIFDASKNKFDAVGLSDLTRKIYNTDLVASSNAIKTTKRASQFKTINLLVKIGGQEWTPVYAKYQNDTAYIVFWLAKSEEKVKETQIASYPNSDMRKMLTGYGSSTVAQSAKWADFESKLSDYIYTDSAYGSYGTDTLWVPSASYFVSMSGSGSSTNLAIGGSYGVSQEQASNSIATALKVSDSYDFKASNTSYGEFYIYSINAEGTQSVIPNEYLERELNGLYALRPCFALNLSKAYASTEKETPVVNPQVTYTGSLYTSSVMPTISLSTGDTAGTISWTDTTLTAGTNEYNWSFTPSSSAYKAVTGKYTLTVLPVAFDRVTYVFNPDTNPIYTNTPLSTLKDYLTVTAYNNDGTTVGVVASEDYELYGTLTEGTSTLTLTYGGKAFNVTITGVQSAGQVTFDRLIITKQPDKLDYKAYEILNTTGMEVTARYSNGDKIVTGYEVVYLDDIDGNAKDYFLFNERKVTISYTDQNGNTQTADLAVTVDKADSTVNPVFEVSDILYTSHNMPQITGISGDTDGVFTWDDIDGAPAKLIAGTNSYGWTFTPTDNANYKAVTGTYTLTVHAVALESITVEYIPETDDEGEPVKIYTSTALGSIHTVNVIGTNNDGSLYTEFNADGSIPATEYVLTGKLVAGNNTVTVTYGGKVATFALTGVIEKAIEKIEASYPVNAHNIYASYKPEQLKAQLTVKAIYNDGTEEELKYYELINNLGDTSDPNLTVKYGDLEYSFTPANFVSTVNVTGIEATYTATDLVYANANLNSLKKYLKIKLIYDDGSNEEVSAEELTGLSLTGSIAAGDNNQITAVYNSKATTFEVNGVIGVKLESISATIELPETVQITTATVLDTLKQYVTVNAKYNYTETEVLIADQTKISLIGALKAPECEIVVVYNDTALGVKTSTVIKLESVEQYKSTPVVTPKVAINGVLVEGKALPTITLAEGGTAGTITWAEVDGAIPVLKAGQEKYGWKFTPTDSDKYEELTGEYWLTADSAKVVKLTVTRSLVSGTIYTDLDSTELKEFFKVVASYNDGRRDVELDPQDYDISAVLKVGSSSVVFSYTDENDNTVTQSVEVAAAAREGEKTVNVGWDGESAYEYTGKQPKLSAYTTNTNEKLVLEYKFEVKNEDGTYSLVERAVDAGEYRAVAQDVAGKYKVGRGEYFYFAISPKNIVRPVSLSGSDYKYTGSEQEFLLDGFNADIMKVTGNKQTEAGSYTVTVELTDANYKFAVGDGTASTLSYVFNIVKPEESGTPNVTVQGNSMSTIVIVLIIVLTVVVLIIALTAIVIAVKSRGGNGDNDGFYDNITADDLK